MKDGKQLPSALPSNAAQMYAYYTHSVCVCVFCTPTHTYKDTNFFLI